MSTFQQPASAMFEISEKRVIRYLVDCDAYPKLGWPNLFVGEAVSLGVDGPVPHALAPEQPTWGYIRSWNAKTRMLEVVPK